MDFNYQDAEGLLGNRQQGDFPCPFCSHLRKRGHEKLKPFGLKREFSPDRILYKCFNCEAKGQVTEAWGKPRTFSESRRSPPRPESRTPRKPSANTAMAQQHWDRTVPAEGTLAEDYWRFRKLELPIPPTIRFHPHAQTVTVAAAMPEYDADGYWIAPRKVSGIHRTPINLSDESGHGTRMALGPIAGHPMVVHQNLEKLTLLIGEGFEKTHAAATAYNVDGWSVGGKSMFSHLVDVIPNHMETIILIEDLRAEQEILDFGHQLQDRGFEVLKIGIVGGQHG